MGIPIGEFLRKDPFLVEDVRTRMLAGIAAARKGPTPKPVEHWGRCRSDSGASNMRDWSSSIICDQSERVPAAQLVADVHLLRKDDALFEDILGFFVATAYRLPPWSPTSPTNATRVARRLSLASTERYTPD